MPVEVDWVQAFDGFSDSLRLSDYFHEKQRLVSSDINNLIALIGGRRSGKTDMMVAKGLEIADQFPGEMVAYVAPTIKDAVNIVIPKVEELAKRYGIHFHIHRGDYYIITPRGGRLQLFGLSTGPDAEKGRGKRFPAVLIDEAGAHRQDLLELCIAETFGPATADFLGLGGGKVIVAGTPPYVAETYWERMCGGNTHVSRTGASVHHMTIYDNPFFRGREELVLDNWCKTTGLTRESSRFLREWMGQFCIDTQGLCYPGWDGLFLSHSQIPRDGTTHIGLDLGHASPNAWVVARIVPTFRPVPGSNTIREGQRVHFLESFECAKIGMKDIADVTRMFADRYGAGLMRGDSGGLGAQVIHDLSDTYGIPIEPVKKVKVASQIWKLDSLFRAGDAVVHEAAASLGHQLRSTPWNDTRTGHHERYPNHSLDAAHYSISEGVHVAELDHVLPPAAGTKEYALLQHDLELRQLGWRN